MVAIAWNPLGFPLIMARPKGRTFNVAYYRENILAALTQLQPMIYRASGVPRAIFERNLPGLFINSKAKQRMKSCSTRILNTGNAYCSADQTLLTVRLKRSDQGLDSDGIALIENISE
jgi:hypothetical protein